MTILEADLVSDVIKELQPQLNKEDKCLAKLYDVFSYKGNLFLVTEYFENGSLGDLVSSTFINIFTLDRIWKDPIRAGMCYTRSFAA